MPADAATEARVEHQDCQGDQGDCGGRPLRFPSSADPSWNGERGSCEPQDDGRGGAERTRVPGLGERWLVVNGDGEEFLARHGRLL